MTKFSAKSMLDYYKIWLIVKYQNKYNIKLKHKSLNTPSFTLKYYLAKIDIALKMLTITKIWYNIFY